MTVGFATFTPVMVVTPAPTTITTAQILAVAVTLQYPEAIPPLPVQ